MDIVGEILDELDTDGSGEVSCDEFCILMAKMLGPDGKVDLEKMLRSKEEAKSLERRQQEIFTAVPLHTQEIACHKELIEQEQLKLSKTDQRVRSMEDDYVDLRNEVRKLREGLDLNQE